MAALTHDCFQLVATHIDDPVTFNAFARASRVCARAARLVTPLKKQQLQQFWIWPLYSNDEMLVGRFYSYTNMQIFPPPGNNHHYAHIYPHKTMVVDKGGSATVVSSVVADNRELFEKGQALLQGQTKFCWLESRVIRFFATT